MCASRGGYIVCANKPEAERIFDMSKDMKLNISLPITYKDFITNNYYSKGISNFYIDNVEHLLNYMLPFVKIRAVTLLKEK